MILKPQFENRKDCGFTISFKRCMLLTFLVLIHVSSGEYVDISRHLINNILKKESSKSALVTGNVACLSYHGWDGIEQK